MIDIYVEPGGKKAIVWSLECAASLSETVLRDSFTFFTFSYFFVQSTKKYENVKNVKLSLRRRARRRRAHGPGREESKGDMRLIRSRSHP